jgi:hypothetical protein
MRGNQIPGGIRDGANGGVIAAKATSKPSPSAHLVGNGREIIQEPARRAFI